MTSPSAPAGALARRVGTGDAFYDYTGFPYEPVTDPTGKWSSSFVFEAVLDATGAQAVKPVALALREFLGWDATVWGAKGFAGQYSWELYFYDYTREDSRFDVSRLLEVIGQPVPEGLPATADIRPRRPFMVSIDVPVGSAHFYFYDVGERMTGLSYRYDAGWRLENHYSFYDPATDSVLLREKVMDSPHAGTDAAAQQVLVPDFLACRRVCVANKPGCDGVYFSGVDVAQFIRFLEFFEHDPALVAVIRENETALDHMLYDVAFDYRTSASGGLEILKTAFYGTA